MASGLLTVASMSFRRLATAVVPLLAFAATNARAIPTLQLDIVNGVYNSVDETTYATTPQFTLRALFDGTLSSQTYYISAGIEPLMQQANPPNVGTFSIDGTAYSPATMAWGTPPLNVPDNNSGGGPGNLGTHGEFPTYYTEDAFTFSSSLTMPAYNTADGTSANGNVYYHDFLVDVSNLKPGYSVHFDLYDEKLKKGSYTIDDFAPFSHDAQSGPTSVPDDGSTVLLLGLALAGVTLMYRSGRNRARA